VGKIKMRSTTNRLFTELEIAYQQAVHALAIAVDAKDRDTADHAYKLTVLAVQIGKEMHLSKNELRDLRYGAILHDIGKIGVPDSILKKPTQLDENEWTEMRAHPLIGAEILAAIPHLAGIAQIVLHHHERFDGLGYPFGLKGDCIPLCARILSVVDAYGAMVDQRVYKAARSHETAVAELKRCAGTQFDPDVVHVFLRLAYGKRTTEVPHHPRALVTSH
jgi:HD-GYP domain-containing protein (c-di-GMP phosphodiesterase class II)